MSQKKTSSLDVERAKKILDQEGDELTKEINTAYYLYLKELQNQKQSEKENHFINNPSQWAYCGRFQNNPPLLSITGYAIGGHEYEIFIRKDSSDYFLFCEQHGLDVYNSDNIIACRRTAGDEGEQYQYVFNRGNYFGIISCGNEYY